MFLKKNYKAKFSSNSILKKNIDKYNFEKNHKKNLRGNTVVIHSVL
jgi:hypothetical protein